MRMVSWWGSTLYPMCVRQNATHFRLVMSTVSVLLSPQGCWLSIDVSVLLWIVEVPFSYDVSDCCDRSNKILRDGKDVAAASSCKLAAASSRWLRAFQLLPAAAWLQGDRLVIQHPLHWLSVESAPCLLVALSHPCHYLNLLAPPRPS